MTSFMFSNQDLHAKHAVLLYGQGAQISYASVHDVHQDETGHLAIQAGVPATLNGLRQLFSELNPDEQQRPEFFDGNILSCGPGWLVWWMRPQSRRVWFQADKIGERTEVVPHPGLVFAVSPSGWQVFATVSNRRPTKGAVLYQAPYYNVWENGQICTGSADVPKGDASRSPGKWEKAFFESRFSHPNVNGNGRLVKYRGGPVKFWKELLDGRHEKFPTEVLVPAGLTVDALLQNIARSWTT